MQVIFTPAGERAIAEAGRWSTGRGDAELQTVPMLLGLLAEAECRAAAILHRHDISMETIKGHWPNLHIKPEDSPDAPIAPEYPHFFGGIKPSPDLQMSLEIVTQWLGDNFQSLELATEHILLGLADADHELGRWLREQGVDPRSIREKIAQSYDWPAETVSPQAVDMPQEDLPDEIEPLAMGDYIGSHVPAEELTPQSTLRILRVIDAAANRAREGLRVVEDYVRFVLDDAHLTGQLKQLRHDLVAALATISPYIRLVARETQHDVGTGLTTDSERARGESGDVFTANLVRLQESLRSLEEFGKLLDPGMAAGMKQLRYKAYTIERAVTITANSLQRLAGAKLYVLIDGCSSQREFEKLARSLIESGVHIIQLRDKRFDDRQLLARGRQLAMLCSGGPTLFIMNDRADLAALSGADGVHLGQEELSVKDARSIVGPHALVGVSTHSIKQARAAVIDGADYIGVGPTFASGTKQFAEFPGVELLRAVSAEIRLPAFAIGGIDATNIGRVLEAGFTRVAVSGAITKAEDAGRAADELLAMLE